jgi:hypothetical protein
MVTIRSSSGMKAERAPSSVVFPEAAPPEIRMLDRDRTLAWRKDIISSVAEPIRTRSSGPSAATPNFRTVTTGPQSERGGMIA